MKKSQIILIAIASLFLGVLIEIRLSGNQQNNNDIVSVTKPKIIKKTPYKNRYYISEQYRQEVEQYMSQKGLEVEKNVDKILIEVQKHYENFLQNNYKELSKGDYCFELNNFERAIEVEDFDFYHGIIELTDKYRPVSQTIPPTDFSGTLAEHVLPYMHANNVNLKSEEKMYKHIEYAYRKIEEYSQKIVATSTAEDFSKSMRLIKSYPKASVYYYYYESFNPINFVRPYDIPQGIPYVMFVYNDNLSKSSFETYSNNYECYDIKEDSREYYFGMLCAGTDVAPPYYFIKYDGIKTKIYKIEKNQIVLYKQNRKGRFEKQKVLKSKEFSVYNNTGI